MRIIRGLDKLVPALGQSVLTVGNFDGVHRAHQQLLAQTRRLADEAGGPVTVLTFEPHPLTVVAPHKAPPRLSTPEEKLRCLAEAGAEIVVVAESNLDLLRLEPEQFVREVLQEKFRPTHIVEGPSFGFGRGRRGNPELLRRIAAEFGCEVHIVEPVTVQIDGERSVLVSSSLIRTLLGEGRVRPAALCLGRPYALLGNVVRGELRGRRLGFPTANLGDVQQLVPRTGVYSGRVVLDHGVFAAGISIGRTPTFDGQVERVEAYLLDFDGDLYGQSIRLEFHDFLREQRKFDSPQALVQQLHKDVETVRETRDWKQETTN